MRLVERVDDLATRAANVEWASRPRANRARWAIALAIEMFVVLTIGAFVFARATDDNAIWVVVVGVDLWFAVFLLLLVRRPPTAFKWGIYSAPIIPITAIAAAFITTR